MAASPAADALGSSISASKGCVMRKRRGRLHGGRILKDELIPQRKRRASGEYAGYSFAYAAQQTQCTGTVRIIAPSHGEEYAVNLLLCPKLNKRILFTYACVGNMVYQTSCGIFDILCVHVFTLPGANFKFIDDVFNKHHINEQW